MKRFFVLFAVAFAVFFPSLNGTYLYWDDSTHIINNPNLVSGDLLEFWTGEYYRLYIPMIYTVWGWLFMITASPWIYHVFNYVLHAANGTMFYRMARLTVPSAGSTVLWLATLAFMVHPLQTEPVAWIAGGRDLLSTFFALAAALVLWRATTWPWFVGATVLFLASLLSKATTAPLPVALLVIPAFRQIATRWHKATLGIWLGSAVVVMYINKMVQQADSDNLIKPLTLFERALTVLDTMGFYLQKIVVPWPLSGDYGRIPSAVVQQQMYWMPIAILLVVTAAVGVGKYFYPRMPVFGWVFFYMILGPVLGVITFMAQSQSSVADRYVYFAWMGPCLMLVFALNHFPKLKPAMIALLVVWSGLSFQRAEIWTDPPVLMLSSSHRWMLA